MAASMKKKASQDLSRKPSDLQVPTLIVTENEVKSFFLAGMKKNSWFCRSSTLTAKIEKSSILPPYGVREIN